MDTYVYRIDDSNYINLTNKCTNDCTFCIRNNSDGVTEKSLWLESEPTSEEVISILSKDKRDIVFCGYGEPTIKLNEIIEISKYVKSYSGKVRLNTNGHGNAYNGYNIVPKLVGFVDAVSISLNQCTPEKYFKICKSIYGLDAFDHVIDFIKCCKDSGLNIILSVLDFIGQDDIEACREIANKYSAVLRIRTFI